MTAMEHNIAMARLDQLSALVALEARCFQTDRIQRRSFKHWIDNDDAIFRVMSSGETLVGYGLVLCNRGTKLARLYSLAVSPDFQNQGIARQLIECLESDAKNRQRLFMRLEVAKHNTGAYHLYEKLGYRPFGTYANYYQDEDDAVRMQKTIYTAQSEIMSRKLPWYQQTTEFTCGPAALMMAMSNGAEHYEPKQSAELDIWREANTIFMTSGHGGTHPFGLALAAHRRGYLAQVLVNTEEALFLDGVRSDHKKDIVKTVHQQFLEQLKTTNIDLRYESPNVEWMQRQMDSGFTVIILISTYRMDKKKTPHWVAVTHIDDRCIFVHDPDVDDLQRSVDCQHVPIALEDFDKMAAFGKQKLRTAIAIKAA